MAGTIMCFLSHLFALVLDPMWTNPGPVSPLSSQPCHHGRMNRSWDCAPEDLWPWALFSCSFPLWGSQDSSSSIILATVSLFPSRLAQGPQDTKAGDLAHI